MQLRIDPKGSVRCLYGEAIDLTVFGSTRIHRASHVEPDGEGRWWSQIIGGPKLGPFDRRSAALAAEQQWLEQNWLGADSE